MIPPPGVPVLVTYIGKLDYLLRIITQLCLCLWYLGKCVRHAILARRKLQSLWMKLVEVWNYVRDNADSLNYRTIIDMVQNIYFGGRAMMQDLQAARRNWWSGIIIIRAFFVISPNRSYEFFLRSRWFKVLIHDLLLVLLFVLELVCIHSLYRMDLLILCRVYYMDLLILCQKLNLEPNNLIFSVNFLLSVSSFNTKNPLVPYSLLLINFVILVYYCIQYSALDISHTIQLWYRKEDDSLSF